MQLSEARGRQVTKYRLTAPEAVAEIKKLAAAAIPATSTARSDLDQWIS